MPIKFVFTNDDTVQGQLGQGPNLARGQGGQLQQMPYTRTPERRVWRTTHEEIGTDASEVSLQPVVSSLGRPHARGGFSMPAGFISGLCGAGVFWAVSNVLEGLVKIGLAVAVAVVAYAFFKQSGPKAAR